MTRKHFKAMAAQIATMADREDAKRTAEVLATQCKMVNSRFDRSRFMAACGL
jgi:hypothetical protein